MKKKLRLLVTPDCNRTCAGCCNKDWDLNKLQTCTDFHGYSEIMLTGGEPSLVIDKVEKILIAINKQNPKAYVYIYTAKPEIAYLDMIADGLLTGITLTLHTMRDIAPFVIFNEHLEVRDFYANIKIASFRLNVFKSVRFKAHGIIADMWVIKDNIEWIKDCPLPKDEVFMKI